MPRLRPLTRVCVGLTAIVLVIAGTVAVAARSWSDHEEHNGGRLAKAIVGDWVGERQIPVWRYPSPPEFVRDPNVFMRFTADGHVTIRIHNDFLGTQERQGDYRVSGRTIVLAGITCCFAGVMHDVSFEDDTLRFVMRPSPAAFTQDAEAAVYELDRQ